MTSEYEGREPEEVTLTSRKYPQSPSSTLGEETEYESDETQEGDPNNFIPFSETDSEYESDEDETQEGDPQSFTPFGERQGSESESESEYESDEDETQEGDPQSFTPFSERQGIETESEYESDETQEGDPQSFTPFSERQGSETEEEDDFVPREFPQPFGLTTQSTGFQPLVKGQQKIGEREGFLSSRKSFPEKQEDEEKTGKFASTFKKVKSILSGPEYEQLLRNNGEELKSLYISYLNEYFDEIEKGEDLDTIKENYIKFVEQYYKEAYKKDKLLLEKLKDA